MVASKLTKYLNEKDKNNVMVASWAVDTGKSGVARCKYCQSDVKFSSGKAELFKHSERLKHINATPKDTTVRQMSLNECLSASQEKETEEKQIQDKAREFEISLARSLSNHNICMEFAECLQAQLKKYCGDSCVVEKLQLGRRKCEVLVRQGIATTFREETVSMLRECNAFSVGFDESEINKTSELEIMVRIATSSGIDLRHYRTLDLYSATAANIVNDLLSQFDEDGVDYKNKLICAMTDGCNTMQGHLGGVKKLLRDKITELLDPGSCNDHHLSNAMKHAVNAFDPDIEQALVNIYMDIGGAPGRGLTRKKAFEKVCKEVGLSPIMPIKKFCSTRFRNIRTCLKPVLKNWNGIIKYYSQLKKPTNRQNLLRDYFVSREMLSYLNMNFIYSATREIDEAIDHFEKRETLVFDTREKMEKILRSSILKFHMETAVKELDDEGNVVKKTGAQLLQFDVDDTTTKLSKRAIFIGEESKKFISSLSLNPKSAQLSKFYEKVTMFHRTVTLRYIHYFSIGLKSTELDYMSALNPMKFNHMTTPHYLKYLAKRFSKVVRSIEPVEGQDMLFEEIDEYTIDDEVKAISTFEFEVFWIQVGKITESGWPKYKILPSFALAFGTIFNSNSEAERAFSVQTDIHRNPKRNNMLQETFDGHMQVHFGVEGKESRQLCDICINHKNASSDEVTSKPKHHCHCSVAPISEKMMQDCKRKWSLEKSRLELQKIDTEVDKEKATAADEDFTKRTLKFVTSMKTRSTFYSADLMSPVFDKELSDETADATTKKKVLTETADVTTKKKVLTEAANNDLSGCSSTTKKRKGGSEGEKSLKKKKKSATVKEVPISLFKK